MRTTIIRQVILLAFLSAGPATGRAEEDSSVVKLVTQSQEAAAKGNLDAALDKARQAIEKDPAFAEAWKQQGTVQLKKQAYRDAVQSLKTATQIKPQDAGAWLDLGWAYWSLDQRDEALAALDKAIRGNIPNRDRVILQVVARIAEEGAQDKAIEMYRAWEPKGDFLEVGTKLFNMGRIQGALPFLTAAWNAKENPPITGLYLAHARALNGRSTRAEQYLAPFVETELEKASPAQLDMLMETLMLCTDNEGLQPLLDKTDGVVKGQRTYETQVTEILEKTAEEMGNSGNPQHVLALYKRILERDPNRKVWIHAYDLIQSQQGDEASSAFITNLLARATEPSVRNALEGLQANRRGDLPKAIAAYRQSLKADPQQPEIRQHLFTSLIKSGNLDEARKETEWFVKRLDSGDAVMRSYLAEIWSALGDTSKALQFWQMLHLSAPDIGYYGVETARAMFELCRPDEATALLEKMVAANPYPLAFELLGEIEYAMGRPEKAAEWTAKGLEHKQTPGLLRAYSEYAEIAGMSPTSILTVAQTFLNSNPGHVPMSLLTGRTLVNAGLTNEAVEFYTKLLERSPDFSPAQISLRELKTRIHEFGDATQYAKQTAKQRPWDPEAQRRYAVSLAENDQFHPALKTLRHLSDRKVSRATPVLAYRGVFDCPYPNRATVDRILAHLDALNEKGYQFVTPTDIEPAKDEKKVMILFFDLSAKQVDQIDAKLKQMDGRAIYASDTSSLLHETPDKPGKKDLARMQKSGRWMIATVGQSDLSARPVNRAGVLGNPLTHSLFLADGAESGNAYAQRVEQWMSSAAAALPEEGPRLLVYPGGDYGQLSLDTTPEHMEILRDATRKHFDYAVAFDESGFVVSGFDAARLPAKVVSPTWSTNELITFLEQDDPFVRSRFELAKILYWQSQHETANKMYRSGELAAIDPAELYYNWGANAYQQGDYPTAVAMLTKAQELDPTSERTQNALKKAKNQQRPEINARILQWTDNEDRSYLQWGADADIHLTGALKLGVLADRNRWEQDDLGSEEGTRYGGKLFWYLREETWFNAELWRLELDDLRDHSGGLANLHLPNAPLNGFVELQAARQEVETVEALREEIYANILSANTYSRLFDDWDLYANYSQTRRSDDNDTWMVDGRLVYRIDEWPFLGVGYLFRFADSDTDPAEYWAPQGLEQHQLYGTLRGARGRLNYTFSGQAGEAREEDTDWNFVWGGRARADYRIVPKASLMGEVSYFEGPIYDRTTWVGGLSCNF